MALCKSTVVKEMLARGRWRWLCSLKNTLVLCTILVGIGYEKNFSALLGETGTFLQEYSTYPHFLPGVARRWLVIWRTFCSIWRKTELALMFQTACDSSQSRCFSLESLIFFCTRETLACSEFFQATFVAICICLFKVSRRLMSIFRAFGTWLHLEASVFFAGTFPSQTLRMVLSRPFSTTSGSPSWNSHSQSVSICRAFMSSQFTWLLKRFRLENEFSVGVETSRDIALL